MRSPRLRLTTSLLALAAMAVLAAGCSTGPASPAPTSTGGSDAAPSAAPGSPSAEDRDADDIEVAWLDGGRSFAIVTWGSSSDACQPATAEATAEGQTVSVRLMDMDGGDAVCTADFGPRTIAVPVPKRVDVTQDVEVRVDYQDITDDADLDALAAAPQRETDFQPSAGWFDDRGIVLLTYGSSSCAPVVENVEQTDAGATVTFAEIDGACTMDMAPRLTIVVVPDERDDDDAPFQLTLTGGGFDDVAVDVIG